MAQKTPAQVAAKWAQRAQGATQALQDGINNVTVAPGQLAAAKQDKMLANLTAAITSGKWANNVAAVSLQSWKDSMLTKGVQRYGSGVSAAQTKFQSFMSKLLPYQANIQAQLATMPDLTLQDNINRAIYVMQQMAAFKNTQ